MWRGYGLQRFKAWIKRSGGKVHSIVLRHFVHREDAYLVGRNVGCF